MNDIFKKIQFPTSVNIMGFEYKIELVSQLFEDEDTARSLAGQIKFSETEIKILDRLGIQQKWQTLFHEALHGIFDHNHLKGDEDTIDLIANGLMCLFFNSDLRLK
jgi:hypothetical protein